MKISKLFSFSALELYKTVFQANRSMKLQPNIERSDVAMIADAFWYEDNRRIYQVSRRQIDKYEAFTLLIFEQ